MKIKIGKKKYDLVYLMVIAFLLGFLAYYFVLRNLAQSKANEYQSSINKLKLESELLFKEINSEIENFQSQLRGTDKHLQINFQPTINTPNSKEITPVTHVINQPQTKKHYSKSPFDETLPPGVLVVGGTDGSGTRSVVKKLVSLGTTMVSEDPQTYDIHADLVNGWPTIVTPVIKETHSLMYSKSSLSQKTYSFISHAVQRILSQAEEDSYKPESHKLAVGGVLKRPDNINAKGIKFGFKAPVAMTLLPIWVDNLSHSRFIHVLRDGRDIAFSANQGPIDKFYRDMYTDFKLHSINTPLKAIKLWSDWNTQVFNWALQYAETIQGQTPENPFAYIVSNANKDRSFGYFTIYSEDLVSEDLNVRFLAIFRLSQFIRSDMSNEEMCCLALSHQVFMGSHDHSTNSNKVTSRYGKWKQMVENKPDLIRDIQKYGSVGLSQFGYEPQRSYPTENMVKLETGGYVCSAETSICQTKDEKDLSAYNIGNACNLEYGKDYLGGNCNLQIVPCHSIIILY